MGRRRVGLIAIVALLWATGAQAQGSQGSLYTGSVTAHIGTADGGDVREGGLTLGGTMAVVENSGWGAEIDLGHTREFDDVRFTESGITSLMINALGVYPGVKFRPFGSGGVGLLRVRAAIADGVPVTSRTDWGFNAGAGLLYMFNEAFGVRGDVRYFRFFQRQDDLPLLDNGFFDYWRTSMGLTYTWPIK